MSSFFFRKLQLITVLFLICDSYMLKHKVRLSLKLCVGFTFVFIKVQQMQRPFEFKTP